jgi:WD40 repeat protein
MLPLTVKPTKFARIKEFTVKTSAFKISILFFVVLSLQSAFVRAQSRPDIQWMRGGNPGPQGKPQYLADGERFVTASFGAIQYRRASDGILLKTVYAFDVLAINDLALSPDKQILAAVGNPTGSTASVKLYNANDGTFVREISLPGIQSQYVAFSPDGQSIAVNSGVGSTIQRWRISDGTLLNTYEPGDPQTESTNPAITDFPAFSPDGEYISGTERNGSALVIVRVSNGSLVKTYNLNSFGAGNRGTVFSPNGQYIVAPRRNMNTIAVWSLSASCIGSTCEPVAILGSDAGGDRNLVFSPDGTKLALGGLSGGQSENRLWNTVNWSLIRSYSSNNISGHTRVTFTPDGTGLLSASHDIKLWSVADGSLIQSFDVHSAVVTSVAYSPDGQTVASATNTNAGSNNAIPGIYLWRASDGALLRTMDFGANSAGGVSSLAFSPNGLTVAATGSLFPNGTQTRKVKLFEVSTGSLIRTIDTAGDGSIVFSPDGQSVAVRNPGGGATDLYRVSDGALVRTITNLIPVALAFSPDGSNITDGRAVYQVSNGSLLFSISGNPSFPNGAAYSPDGQLIASVSGNNIHVHNAANGAFVRGLSGHTLLATVAVFSPDSQSILSAGQDGTLRFWRVSDGALLQTYTEETGFSSGTSGTQINGGAFSPDGQYFIYGRGTDATIVKARNPLSVPEPTDISPPTSQSSLSSQPNGQGWHNLDVTVSLFASDDDGGSGVQSISYSLSGAQPANETTASGSSANVVITSQGETTITYFATDVANNVETAHTLTVKLDKTSPDVSCESSDGVWHAEDVSVACTAGDAISSLAFGADASFHLDTTTVAGTETANNATGARVVCDIAGNCQTAGPITGNKIDKKAPVVTITSPTAGLFLLNQSVTVGYTCTDGGSGVAACTGTVPNGGALNTASAGQKVFTVSSSDNVGNAAAPVSVNYSVRFGIVALYDQTKPNKANSIVPIKIRLVDANGNNVSSAGTVVHAIGVVRTGSQVSGATVAAAPVSSDVDFRYDATIAGYAYNLQSKGLAAGTYALRFIAGGDAAAVYTVQFAIKK